MARRWRNTPNEIVLYAEVLQAHQFRVLICYHRRQLVRAPHDENTDPNRPLREFSPPAYGPHLPTSFLREQWRHRQSEQLGDIRVDVPPAHPSGPHGGPCQQFLSRHYGGWPDIQELPDGLVIPDSWRERVAPTLLLELEYLYFAGMHLVREHGQAFYEHYGARCFLENADGEVWSYGPISGMRARGRSPLAYTSIAQDAALIPIGPWSRAQLLVINVATTRLGHGPFRNNVPPPAGTLDLLTCRTSTDGDRPPREIKADYAALRLEEPGF